MRSVVRRARPFFAAALGSVWLLACGIIAGIEDLALTNDGRADGTADGELDAAGSDGGHSDATGDAGIDARCGACGPTAGVDCCASSLVGGGTFARSFDGVAGGGFEDAASTATVADFRLDDFEVTVGRFRAFVDAYPASRPAANAGRNPSDPSDTGWDATWNALMPSDRDALSTALECPTLGGVPDSWSNDAGAREQLPLNCATWFEAYAFCIWDGGRLPTEAEWNYAAAGGSQQRAYPWSVPPTSVAIDASYAVLEVYALAVPGSRSPKGDGRFGASDLAGNVGEWVLDWFGSYPMPCNNCANRAASDAGRVSRGGSILDTEDVLKSSYRQAEPPTARTLARGFRCARSP